MPLKEGLEPLPPSMAHLCIDPERGFPVPWFIAWVDGKPEFRMAEGQKLHVAVNQNRCWVCGRRHEPGRVTYVVGPMCAINRVSAEPPSHLICAEYAVRNCPFLTRPQMTRRGHEEIAAQGSSAGMMIERNPGVTLLWTTGRIETFGDRNGGVLFRLGEPLAVSFWAQGRAASRAEVMRSVETGLPILEDAARQDGPAAGAALLRMVRRFEEEIVPRIERTEARP